MPTEGITIKEFKKQLLLAQQTWFDQYKAPLGEHKRYFLGAVNRLDRLIKTI
jgi:hypothetical protein